MKVVILQGVTYHSALTGNRKSVFINMHNFFKGCDSPRTLLFLNFQDVALMSKAAHQQKQPALPVQS